jgi:outer membrane phospholipase A
MRSWQISLVFALVLSTLSPAVLAGQTTVTVQGIVTDSVTGEPLQGALVVLEGIEPGDTVDSGRVFHDETDASGTFGVEAPPGRYELTVQRTGYSGQRDTLVLTPGGTVTRSVALRAADVNLAHFAFFSGQMHSEHFELNEPSYFIFGFGDGGEERTPADYSNQVKFRIAVRYRLAQLRVKYDTGLFFAYTQNSFWHLYDFDESAPFFDNNFNPQIFFHRDARDYHDDPSYWLPSPRVFLEHESNGRDGPASRSWNRVGGALEWGDPQEDRVYWSVSLWHAFGIGDENPEIRDTNGRGEVRLAVQPRLRGGEHGLGELGFLLKSRILGEDPVANVEANVFADLGTLTRISGVLPTFMGQVFWGTGENLLTYDEKRLVVRLGIAFIK